MNAERLEIASSTPRVLTPAQKLLRLAAARDARSRALVEEYQRSGSLKALAAALQTAGLGRG
jgi:hypothetical protein